MGFAALALTLTTGTAAHAAPRTVTGEITCLNSASPVGVWVDAQTGKDGWASTRVPYVLGGHSKVVYTYTLSNGGSFRVNVGCGGTSKKWGMSLSSPWVSGNANLRCNDIHPVLLAAFKIINRSKVNLAQGIAYGSCKQV